MFQKGDIVVSKEEFLDKNETVRDTIGMVLEYNPSNDYLLLGVLDPEKYSIPPSFSMRGCYYRLATGRELHEWENRAAKKSEHESR